MQLFELAITNKLALKLYFGTIGFNFFGQRRTKS
jgi:hypothetical protein